MRIKLVDICSEADGSYWVTFESTAGRVRARWSNKTVLPKPGKEYDAELYVAATADRQTNAQTSSDKSTRLLVFGDMIEVSARIEDVEDDDVMFLRLSPDCLVMIDSTGGFTAGEFVSIRLPTDALSVTVVGS